jgi:hypothetical protein
MSNKIKIVRTILPFSQGIFGKIFSGNIGPEEFWGKIGFGLKGVLQPPDSTLMRQTPAPPSRPRFRCKVEKPMPLTTCSQS